MSVQFRANYCDAKKPVVLVGKEVSMESIQVNGDFYQVYQLKEKERVLLSPNDVEADQSSATLGLFFLTFLLVALVIYKSRRVSNKS